MGDDIKPPLKGVRIVDFTQVMAGPQCTMMLGDMGAEVIKVEPPGGDYSRQMPPHFHQGDSAYYLGLNKNKKSIVVDLKQPQGRQVIYDLVRRADVVVDNFRPGVMQKLEIHYEALQAINPKIIACSISGFGSDSPYAQRPALDLIIQAMGGAMSFTGEPDRPPVRMGIPMGDLAAGIFATSGILAALYARQESGQGRKIDISMLDCQIALMTYRAQYLFLAGEIPQPVGSGHVSSVPIRAFKTKDDYLVIDSGGDRFWRKLCRALEIEELADDPRFCSREQRLQNKALVMEILERRFATKTQAEWLRILSAAGVPHGPVNNLAQALADPSVTHRDMVVDVRRGGDELKMLGNPIKMAHTPQKYTAPPFQGEDSVEILREIVDYSQDRIDALLQAGAVKTSSRPKTG